MDRKDFSDSRAQQLKTWLVGGLIGFGVSFLIFSGFLNDAILAVPLIGQRLLVDPSYTKPAILPAIVWGVIGALLASEQNQRSLGMFLLIVYIVVGCVVFFQFVMMIPT